MARGALSQLVALTPLMMPLVATAASAAVNEESSYQFPAEWEPHEAVWLGWPPFVYLEKYGRTNKDVSVDILCVLANFSVPVRLAVSDSDQFEEASSMLTSRCPQHSVGKYDQQQDGSAPQISVVTDVPHSDAWWRDMGAQFLVNQGGSGDRSARLRVLDVNFGYWGWTTQDGYWQDNAIDENVDRLTALRLGLQTSTHTDWSHEGGNVDAFRPPEQGDGSALPPRLMSVRAVELQRNPELTLEEIDTKMLASYGYPSMPSGSAVSDALGVVWLDEGLVDDDLPWTGPFDFGLGKPVYTFGTGGHVDEVARWTPDGSVLLTMPSAEEAAEGPAQNESRARMLRNAELLRGANISVIELPAAPTLTITLEPDSDPMSLYAVLRDANNTCDPLKPYTSCQDFPHGEAVQVAVAASYANFLVTNGVVLIQKYCVPGLCEERPELAEADARGGRAEAGVRRGSGAGGHRRLRDESRRRRGALLHTAAAGRGGPHSAGCAALAAWWQVVGAGRREGHLSSTVRSSEAKVCCPSLSHHDAVWFL